MFLKGEADAVDVLYTRFINTLSQRPDARALLPIGSAESLLSRGARPGSAAEPAEPRPH